ncbi:MAG: hypothetical protein QXR23_08900 [Ignisphaera sp.]
MSQTQKKMVLREDYRNNIKMPGRTLSIVVNDRGEKLEPVRRIRSRTGAHGEDIYVIYEPVYILRYNRSNSGKVRWAVYRAIPPNKVNRVRFSDLPTFIQNWLKEYAEQEGLELHEFEEESEFF